MPVPQPNLYPPFNIVRLSHVEFGVTDLAKSRAFYVDTLGLQVTDETADTIYLRAMEERGHHCIVLKKSETAEARDLGFKVFDEEDLDKAVHFFKGKDHPSGGDQVYFLFIGACEDKGVTFEFVQKIAHRFRNTGVVVIRDLEAFVAQSDEELNATLLGPELVAWLKS